MNETEYELAAILASPDPGTLYSGMSVLVSAAVDGGRCAVLVSFGALELIDGPGAGPPPELARSFQELRGTLLSLENVSVWACAASSESIETSLPVMSTPRFLRETARARRLIHV